MTLMEALAKIPEDSVVAIGSKSGYIFVEQAKLFRKLEPALSLQAHKEFEVKLKSANESVKILLEGMPPYDPDAWDSELEYANRLVEMGNGLRWNLKCVDTFSLYLKNWKDFYARNVRSVKRTPINNVRQILIEGLELGEFWTIEEFDAWMERENVA